MDKEYGMIKRFFAERKVKTVSIKEANGNIIYEEVYVTKYWKGYLEQLYHKEDITIKVEMEEHN